MWPAQACPAGIWARVCPSALISWPMLPPCPTSLRWVYEGCPSLLAHCNDSMHSGTVTGWGWESGCWFHGLTEFRPLCLSIPISTAHHSQTVGRRLMGWRLDVGKTRASQASLWLTSTGWALRHLTCGGRGRLCRPGPLPCQAPGPSFAPSLLGSKGPARCSPHLTGSQD